MTRAPRLTGKKLITILRYAGFEIIRTKGSHHVLQHSDGRVTVVPVHPGEIVGIGLLGKILHDCELTLEDLRKILKQT